MILLDNSNRKPILRLYFNSLTNKQIGLPGEGRDSYGRREIPAYSIESVDEITGYADQIRDVVIRYLKEDGDPRETGVKSKDQVDNISTRLLIQTDDI